METCLRWDVSDAPRRIREEHRKVIAGHETHQSAEPLIWGADRAYYVRRQLHEDLYRRHLGYAERVSKHNTHAEGKKSLPVPMGQPRHEEGCMHFPDRQMQRSSTMPEPAIPKMARYTGNARYMESSQEMSLDEALNRKVRVGRDSYHQSGRAGDLSIRTGPTPRVEDESAYRQHTIDSPSFVRFCNSLPKRPEEGPVERHHAAMQRQESAVQQSAADDVARLDAWDVQQQERLAALAAQQAAAAAPTSKAGNKK